MDHKSQVNLDSQNEKVDIVEIDDEIDEEFTSKKNNFELPTPLSNEELAQMMGILKNKSHKELLTYLKQLLTSNLPENMDGLQKMQIETNIQKKYENASKREIISGINISINNKNKDIIFKQQEKAIFVEEKLSREELRQKLRNKLKTTSHNNNNPHKMYEKLQEELQQLNMGENNEIQENDNNTEEKKKKKNKKIDPKKIQSQLINQMASYIKNNHSSFTGKPTSA
jgi:hypothetical protein